MERKPSKGVIFWASLFIISSILGILDFNRHIPQSQVKFLMMITLMYIFILHIATIFSGIYLLKLKEFARRMTIVLCLIPIGNAFFIICDFYFFHAFNYEKGIAENILKHPIIMVVYLFIWISIFLLPVFFFTRPTVKEQFK